MKQHTIGLRKKIIGVVITIIIAIMGPLTYINITRDRDQRIGQMQARAKDIAKTVGISLYEPLLKEEELGSRYDVLAETICEEDEDIFFVTIRDYEEKIIGHYELDRKGVSPSSYRVKIPIEYSRIDLGEIEMRFSLERLNRELNLARKRSILLTAVILCAGIVLALLLAASIIKPIEKLAAITELIGAGDLEQRINIRTHDEIEDLGIMVNRMAENLAEHQKKLKQHIGDLKQLGQLTLDISSQIYQENLLDIVVKNFVNLAKVRKCSLMLFDEDRNELVMRYGIGVDELVKKQVRLKLGEGIAGKVAKTGKYMIIDDVRTSPDYIVFDDQYQPRHKEALLAIPLLIEKKAVGVVTVNSRIMDDSFSEDEISILLMFANHIAAVLHNARLYELAITDGLTMLYVHRYFQLRLDEEIVRAKRYKRPLTLLMLDIDNFKSFNDTYGHQEGDRVLINVARIMKSCVRVNDIVCRYGGEEFAIILVETDQAGARIVAERIRHDIEEFKFTVGAEQRGATISIGLGTWQPEWTKEMFIHKADQALYQAKKTGKNRVALAG